MPEIDVVVQSAGIRETSNDWVDDICNVTGGKERRNFINYLGNQVFYKNLVEDKAMSYPGRNGFSVTTEDFQRDDTVYQFITDACNYGDLYDAPHTSKSNDKKPRRKFYLNPIFSPYFKIPYAHTKEPMYVKLDTISLWLSESAALKTLDGPAKPSKTKSTQKKGKKKSDNDNQGTLEF